MSGTVLHVKNPKISRGCRSAHCLRFPDSGFLFLMPTSFLSLTHCKHLPVLSLSIFGSPNTSLLPFLGSRYKPGVGLPQNLFPWGITTGPSGHCAALLFVLMSSLKGILQRNLQGAPCSEMHTLQTQEPQSPEL